MATVVPDDTGASCGDRVLSDAVGELTFGTSGLALTVVLAMASECESEST